ncbi:MAG: glycosyltransferase family 2 protein [Ferruginibacter sp.]
MKELRRNDVESKSNAGIKRNPEVAVVILNWNGLAYLKKFIPFLLKSTYDNLRFVVADNGSTDASISFLQTQPAIEIIALEKNEGFARGYNLALQQVESDYYVLLNSDVEVTPGWIEPVIALMQQNREIAACQPKILSYHQRNIFEYAGACGGWIDNFGYPFTRGRVFDVCEKDEGQYDDAAPCFWASGAALFVKANAYHEVNGLDEYFFAHQEEIDLCWRLQNAGYQIYVQPASVVYHVGGGTLPSGNSRKTFLNFRNNLIMAHKNFGSFEKIWKLPFRFLLNGIAALRGMPRQSGYRSAILGAHVAYLQWAIKRNNRVSGNIKKKDLQGWYQGSIVWDYFVKGRKRFSEIVNSK